MEITEIRIKLLPGREAYEDRLRAFCTITFDNVTKPWIARAGLPNDFVEAVTDALLALDDKTVLKGLKVSGFLPANDDEYGFVRAGMARARAFEKNPEK